MRGPLSEDLHALSRSDSVATLLNVLCEITGMRFQLDLKKDGVGGSLSAPIVLADGREFGNLCAIDPTPVKLAEPQILSMLTQFAGLIAHELEREQIIATLGHDLRNPLQAVYATGELLERRLTDPVLSGMAARIKLNARRMSALIDDASEARLGGAIGESKPGDDID